MIGLPIERILLRRALDVGAAAKIGRVAIPERRGPDLAAFLLDDLELDAIDRHRVGPDQQRLRFPDELRIPAERAAVIDGADAVHDVQHRFRSQRSDAAHHRNHGVGVGLGVHVGPRDVVERAVGQVLQAAGHARRVVLFQAGQVDDLGGFARHDAGQVGPGLALAETIHLAIDLGVVAAAVDVARSLHRPALIEPDDTDACRHLRVIAVDLELIRVPVVDDDVAVRHTGAIQRGDHLAQQGDRGHRGRGARGIDLDRDDVGRHDEARPGVRGVASPVSAAMPCVSMARTAGWSMRRFRIACG